MTLVREATEFDREATVAMLGRAFENDPVAVWLHPDADERPGRMAAMYRWVFEEAARGMRLTTAGCEAASLWVFSAAAGRVAAASASSDGDQADEMPSDRRTRLMMESLRSHLPGGDFWHLELVGCEPDRQGTGLGAAVVRAGLERIEGSTAYLETTNRRNLLFYERLGFSVLDEWTVEDQGPHYWSMIRSHG